MIISDVLPLMPLLSFGDYADLYFEDTSFSTIRWDGGRVEEINAGRDAGVGLRYLQGESVFFGHQNSLRNPDAAVLSKKLTPDLKKNKSVLIIQKNDTYIHPATIDSSPVSLGDKIQVLQKLYRTIFNAGPEISQVVFVFAEKEKKNSILNSYGQVVHEQKNYCVLMISVIAFKKGILQTATEVMGGLGGFELLDESYISSQGLSAARRAVEKLSAPHAPVGEMPVVISAEAGGTMIHEAVGHSLEADAVQKGISPVYCGKLGKQVASPLITVVDDPTIPDRRGSYRYDDEGNPAQKTVLIEKGFLKTFLYDVHSARKENIQSNGHGRRQSYRSRPIPRMSNTYIAPGTDDPAEIIGSLSEGLFVKKMGGGQVNTATGDFIFEVEEGYRIEQGRIKGLVRGANLLGNGPAVLNNIDRLGNDLGWGLGTCGKDGQGVPVGDAQPTLRIKKLLVGGV
ncbi:MAG: TldD/PmbA family protein [bacterium]